MVPVSFGSSHSICSTSSSLPANRRRRREEQMPPRHSLTKRTCPGRPNARRRRKGVSARDAGPEWSQPLPHPTMLSTSTRLRPTSRLRPSAPRPPPTLGGGVVGVPAEGPEITTAKRRKIGEGPVASTTAAAGRRRRRQGSDQVTDGSAGQSASTTV